MAAAAVAGPLDSVARRQSISEENHIDRIRSAYSKRVSEILSTESINHPSLRLDQDLKKSEEKMQERASETALNNSRRFHENWLPTAFLEDVDKNKPNQSLEDIRPMAEKKRKSSISPKVGTTIRQSTVGNRDVGEKRRKSSVASNTSISREQTSKFKQNMQNEANKSRKSRAIKTLNGEHPEKTRKSSISPKVGTTRKQSTVGRRHVGEKGRKTSVSSNTSMTRKQNTEFKQNIQNKTNKSRKTSAVNPLKEEHPEKKKRYSISPNTGTTRRQSTVGSRDVGEKRRKYSVTPNTGMTRKQTTGFKQNTQNETNKSRKISGATALSKENPEKTLKKISRKPSVKTNKTRLNKTPKTQSVERRSSTKNEQIQENFNQSDSSPDDIESDSDEWIEIYNKGNLTSKGSHYPKDAIIFKWIHEELNCPLGPELNILPNASKAEKSPIHVLKKPLKTTMDKSTDEFPDEREPSHVQKESKSRELELDENYSEMQKRESGRTEEIIKDTQNVEMHVSELGKLQIILDPKALSQEDAAMIIWIDDVPESVFVPKYRRRLSLASFPDLQTSGVLIKSVSSESATEVENTASQKPDIYIPSVTLLKNIAVGSKHELKRLNAKDVKNVFYKRCNIGHAYWKLKGQ